MKTLVLSSLVVMGLVVATSSHAWEYYTFDLQPSDAEFMWREAFAAHLEGDQEFRVEGGRVDILTDELAIEIDHTANWHEGLGQALHYADVTHRRGVLALISDVAGARNLTDKMIRRLELIETQCEKHDIQVVVLFPEGLDTTDGEASVSEGSTHRMADGVYWINMSTGVRHNSSCIHFHSTKEGYIGSRYEGRPCNSCGG